MIADMTEWWPHCVLVLEIETITGSNEKKLLSSLIQFIYGQALLNSLKVECV